MHIRKIVYIIAISSLMAASIFAAEKPFNPYEDYAPYKAWKQGNLEYRGEKGPHVLLRSMLSNEFKTENARFQHGDTHLTITLQADEDNFLPGDMANLVVKNSTNPNRTAHFRSQFNKEGYASFEIPYGDGSDAISSSFTSPVNVTVGQGKSNFKQLGVVLPFIAAYLLADGKHFLPVKNSKSLKHALQTEHVGILGEDSKTNTMMALERDFGILATAFGAGGEVATALEKYSLPAGAHPAISHSLSALAMFLTSTAFSKAGQALSDAALPPGIATVGSIFFGAAFTNEIGVALNLVTEQSINDLKDQEEVVWMAPLGASLGMGAGLLGYSVVNQEKLTRALNGNYGENLGNPDSFAITAVYLARGTVAKYMTNVFKDEPMKQELATGGIMLLGGSMACKAMIGYDGGVLLKHFADIVASNLIESSAVSAGFAFGHFLNAYIKDDAVKDKPMAISTSEYLINMVVAYPLFRFARINPNGASSHPGLKSGIAYNLRNGALITAAFASGGVLSGLWDNLVDSLGFKGEHFVEITTN